MKNSIVFFILLMVIPSYLLSQERSSLVGSKAPNLVIEKFYNSQEATSDLEKLKGNVVVLDFWGTWCGPCIKSFAHMNELVTEFEGQAVQFITVGYEDSEKAKAVLDKHNVLSWRAIDTDLSVFESYSAWCIPLVTIINQEGVVVGEMHPNHISKETIKMVLQGKKIQDREDVELPYFDPEGAREHFLSVVKG